MGLLRELRLKAGDNKHVLVLPLEKFTEEVTVGRDAQIGRVRSRPRRSARR